MLLWQKLTIKAFGRMLVDDSGGNGTNSFQQQLEDLWADLRYAFRFTLRNPLFAILAITTLALGIGANTAIFTVVNAVVFRPLPYKDSGRLVTFHSTNPNLGYSGLTPICDLDYTEWSGQTRSMDESAAFRTLASDLTSPGDPERLQGIAATSSFFSVLGAQAQIGRTFSAAEQQPGHEGVILLSRQLWQRKFDSSPSVLEKSVVLDGHSMQVIGVMPADFQFPNQPDYWVPLVLNNTCTKAVNIVAHLAGGATLTQAQTEFDVIRQRLDAARHRNSSDWHSRAVFLKEEVISKVRPILLILFAAVGFVLLIACCNVANLLLARTMTRQREVAVRNALGATRGRIFRQMLTESVLLGVAGGALGILVALWSKGILELPTLQNSARAGLIHSVNPSRIDFWVLGFTFLVSIATGILFGLAPTLQLSKTDPNSALKELSNTVSSSGRTLRLRNAVIIGEFVLAVVLLVSAGLLIKSFIRLTTIELGFNSKNLLTLRLRLPAARYGTDTQMKSFNQQVISRIESIPGVRSAGTIAVGLPIATGGLFGDFSVQGQTVPKDMAAEKLIISNDYFSAMGIPLIKGRFFSPSDGENSPPVIIIGESLARQFWPNEDPIGHQIKPGFSDSEPWFTIVGIVGDVRQLGLGTDIPLAFYMLYSQSPQPALMSNLAIGIRTSGDPLSVAGSVRRQIQAVDPTLPVLDLVSMEQILHQSVSRPRLNTILFSCFALLALVLSTIGVYSVISYSVTERTQEIGIRMAVGARPMDVIRMVLGDAIRLSLTGTVIGLGVALAFTRVLASLLFQVQPTDAFIFSVVPCLLVTVSIIAAYVPANRASRVHPTIALRHE